MKKLLSILIILSILFCISVSIAEKNLDELTLRNGIKFGMSKEEVKKCENSPLKKENPPEYYPVTIAGVNNCLIEYMFGKNDELSTVFVDLSKGSDNYITVSHQYDTINQALIEKYGAPLGNRNGETSIYTSIWFQQFIDYLSLSKAIYNAGYEYKYDEWLFVSDDESYVIKIDHFYEYGKGKKAKDTKLRHMCIYERTKLNQHSNDV